MYTRVGRDFAMYGVLNPGVGDYSRSDVHTNSIEGYFSLLKRGLIGTYHKCGEQHLHATPMNSASATTTASNSESTTYAHRNRTKGHQREASELSVD